ncbi:FAD-dependent protein [Oscillospiraceae bacterium WX1]
MLKISNLKVAPAVGDAGLKKAAAKHLGISADAVSDVQILRRSIDARHKDDVSYVYTLAVSADGEAALLQSADGRISSYMPPEGYAFPYKALSAETRPVVVGLGPAGLFAALCLAEVGLPPIVLERGRPVEARVSDVKRFWETGALDMASNVQFGEGGAGTFSDGKLTTGVSDARIAYVLKRLVEFGAPADILYLAKPHIGTDRLQKLVPAMRKALIALGSDIRFEHQMTGLRFDGGQLREIEVSAPDGPYTLKTRHMILAPGNSARDTFEMLLRNGVQLSPKNFSVGVRIEHRQRDIDLAQYGKASTLGTLPASDYKLAVHLSGGRSVYTFCVCPGGRVVASASEAGGVVTNGMSHYARDGANINGGLLVTVTPEDFDNAPLSGIHFQRTLEQAAFKAGGGGYKAPAQRVADFLAQRASKKPGNVRPTYTPGVNWCNLWDVLPDFVCRAICEALPQMGRKIRGFDSADAVLTAVETRSSSPVCIAREAFEAVGHKGLFPCGEGAGYAGGIMSAAVDGIRAAEALCASL